VQGQRRRTGKVGAPAHGGPPNSGKLRHRSLTRRGLISYGINRIRYCETAARATNANSGGGVVKIGAREQGGIPAAHG